MLKHRILACLLTLSAIAAAPAATSQTAPDYAAIVATPDRSDPDRKLDTNRAPAQWLAFIGAKPGRASGSQPDSLLERSGFEP